MRYDNPEEGKYQLVVRPVDGGDSQEKALASGSMAEGISSPAWSPDGKTIMCNELHAGYVQGLVTVDVASGQERALLQRARRLFCVSNLDAQRQRTARAAP